MESFTSVKASGSSSKRGRTPCGNAIQVVSCVVDGCDADLSKCRDYHRRHKVCEVHSKTPCVTIRGLQQRFCQQCSRFHSLEEFDEGKRSCRKRLEGHNRRRRKPQPEPLPVNPSNFFSSTSQVLGSNRFLPYNNHPLNTQSSSLVGNTSSYSHAYKVRQFPFLQGPDMHFHAGLSFHHNNSYNNNDNDDNNNNNNSQDMLCNGAIDSESSRALSLLSSSSTETLEMGLGRVVDHGPIGPSQWAHNIAPCPTSNLHGLDLDVFQHGRPSDGSSSSGGHQTLSFWE